MLTTLALVCASAAPFDPALFDPLDGRFDTERRTVVDTDGPVITVGGTVVYDGVVVDGAAVFVFDEVVVDEPLDVVGSRPLVLLSTGDLRVTAAITGSARLGEPGPGGGRGGTPGSGGPGQGPGGGDAATGAGGGGFGGDGGDAELEGSGGPSYGDPAVTLEGGSGGGTALLFPPVVGIPSGGGGGGGGAIELGVVRRLEVTSTGTITVDGGDGEPSDQDGGGGGSGGAILLHGGRGRCEGELRARGGKGGADGGALFARGGGGGGGRITVAGLDSSCRGDVSGGDVGRRAGQPGLSTFLSFVPEADPAGQPVADTGEGRAPGRDLVGTDPGTIGCGCRSTGQAPWRLVLLAVGLRRRRAIEVDTGPAGGRMRVRVRYFAVLREQRGVDEEWVDVAEGETLGDLYTRLFPPTRDGVLPIAYARNREYTTAGDRPHDGDEISFLPPIGGG